MLRAIRLLNHFKYSLLSSALLLSCVWFYSSSLTLVSITLILALLEIALSFDNAVLNARILRNMSLLWQKRFLLWGILIAVVGMRLIIPILLVYMTSSMKLTEVILLAFFDANRYGQEVKTAYPLIAAFGSGFLLAVCIHFFTSHRNVYWCPLIEKSSLLLWFQKTSRPSLYASIIMLCIFSAIVSNLKLIVLFATGIILHEFLVFFSKLASSGMNNPAKNVSYRGFISFLYLEILDASFSFDGVVGAFAITTDIIVIMVGLGIGALFVRSLTIYFVRNNTLEKLPYLEHGAHYAITLLAVLLIVKIYCHVPEWITGGCSIGLITLAVYHSKKRHRLQYKKL